MHTVQSGDVRLQVRLSDGGSVSLLWATESAGPREAGAPVLLLLPGINNDAHMGYVQHVQAGGRPWLLRNPLFTASIHSDHACVTSEAASADPTVHVPSMCHVP